MTHKNQDIEIVIAALSSVEAVIEDDDLDNAAKEKLFNKFINNYSDPIVNLLNELRLFRDSTEGREIPLSTHRVIIEGFSDKNSEDALSSALEKAGKYFSEDKDISITLKQLMELPEGGHRATLEIHLTPFSLRNIPKVKPDELIEKHYHQKWFDKFRDQEKEYKRHLIYDHFARNNGAINSNLIPEYLMIKVNDISLMNYMLEKQFFKAGNNKISPIPNKFAVKFLTAELKDDN